MITVQKKIKESILAKMKAELVNLENINALNQVRAVLKKKSPFMENPLFDSYFNRITSQKNHQQPVFAVGIDPNHPQHIKLLYSVHVEYKFTRQLCKCAHIEQISQGLHVSKQEKEQFHKDLINQLGCYKVIALNVTENSILKPNQKFMSIQNKANL